MMYQSLDLTRPVRAICEGDDQNLDQGLRRDF